MLFSSESRLSMRLDCSNSPTVAPQISWVWIMLIQGQAFAKSSYHQFFAQNGVRPMELGGDMAQDL